MQYPLTIDQFIDSLTQEQARKIVDKAYPRTVLNYVGPTGADVAACKAAMEQMSGNIMAIITDEGQLLAHRHTLEIPEGVNVRTTDKGYTIERKRELDAAHHKNMGFEPGPIHYSPTPGREVVCKQGRLAKAKNKTPSPATVTCTECLGWLKEDYVLREKAGLERIPDYYGLADKPKPDKVEPKPDAITFREFI